ncbi:MAG: hypothetical protein WBW07_12545, partial [Azonexus sp.]
QKKRGSASRVKSTPKEEGGGDNPEPRQTLTSRSLWFVRFALWPSPRIAASTFSASHQFYFYRKITFL